jgi:hypothetical protein
MLLRCWLHPGRKVRRILGDQNLVGKSPGARGSRVGLEPGPRLVRGWRSQRWMQCDLSLSHAERDRSYPPCTSDYRCRTDSKRTRTVRDRTPGPGRSGRSCRCTTFGMCTTPESRGGDHDRPTQVRERSEEEEERGQLAAEPSVPSWGNSTFMGRITSGSVSTIPD